MGHLLQRILAERLPTPTIFLHGGTPQKQRDEMVDAFQASQRTRIFILSLRAGGLGLNLTAANHVFHFDRWWNPAVENQATDRAHRIGQKRKVQVHKFIAVGTVEERIDRLLSEKTHLAETIVGGGDEWLTELSTAELREYVRLSEQAVGEFKPWKRNSAAAPESPDRPARFLPPPAGPTVVPCSPPEPKHVLEQLGPPPFRKTSFPVMGFLARFYEHVAAHVSGQS